MEQRPQVGVSVLVVREGKILLGERLNAHGEGAWCSPGGHLEFGESPEACARRELKEETGLCAREVVSGPWTNDFFESEGRHYITIFMFAREVVGEPRLLEPDKCKGWEWFDVQKLPAPLFLPLKNFISCNYFFL